MGRATTTFITGGVRTIGRRGGTTIIHAEDPSLVLDLQFARDQAYVSRRGPLPTFTRASAATRVNSAGLIVPAAIHEPRLDYDPTTLAGRGLLLEEQRTNLFTYSGDFLNAVWVTGYTKTGGFTAPDGTASAVQFSGSSAAISSRQVSAVPSTTLTFSVFVKNVSRSGSGPLAFLVRNDTTATNLSSANFYTNVGTINGTPAANWSVKDYPNGWYRVTVTQATGINVGDNVRFYYCNAGAVADLGAFLLWGAQCEAGAFATTYIPTTSASVIRSADVCSITGSAFTSFYNQSEGTLVFRGIKQALQPTATPSYLGVDDGAATNRIILYGGAAETAIVSASSTIQATLGGVTQAAALTSFAIAMRYKANDFAFCLNGGTVSTDTSGTVPTVTQMLLGTRLGSNFMGGWIQSVQYYNRIKTNAQLQALSTP